MHMRAPINIAEYIANIRKQYPQIRPLEEEDDIEWWNQGLDLIDAGKLNDAEEIFNKLMLAQPDVSDGFNGLGMVYEKKGHPALAAAFFREALVKAQKQVQDGSMDIELLQPIQDDLDRVLKASLP